MKCYEGNQIIFSVNFQPVIVGLGEKVFMHTLLTVPPAQ